MDPREAREFTGTHHHFNPTKNPPETQKMHWWTKFNKQTKPLVIERQYSTGSETASSPPISSPTMASPTANTSGFIFRRQRTLSTDEDGSIFT